MAAYIPVAKAMVLRCFSIKRATRLSENFIATAAYNAEPGNVTDQVPVNGDTEHYVRRITDQMGIALDGSEGETQTSNQKARGNIFGVESYQMPTQGDRITQQVSQLKSGWNEMIPQIGGVLKNKFGINATISSAARTAEHNAAVGGVPTSHHIIRENGGDALDMVFDRETTAAERQKILDYFKGTGLFAEVIYHDAGSGYHLHIGELQTDMQMRQLQKKLQAKKQAQKFRLPKFLPKLRQIRLTAKGTKFRDCYKNLWKTNRLPTNQRNLRIFSGL